MSEPDLAVMDQICMKDDVTAKDATVRVESMIGKHAPSLKLMCYILVYVPLTGKTTIWNLLY